MKSISISLQLLQTIKRQLEYMLAIMESTCDCGECGPCKYQHRVQDTILKVGNNIQAIKK